MSPNPTEVIGSVERVTYFNDESGECVLDVKSENGSRFLIAGRTPFVLPGQSLKAHFLADPAKQKKSQGPLPALSLELQNPRTESALRKFLRANELPGVGDHLSKMIAQTFPRNFVELLETEPTKLLEVPGIGRKKLLQIQESWKQSQARHELEKFLFENDLPLFWSKKLWPAHGVDSLSFLKQFPYKTVSRHDFEFELVDSFALKQGYQLLSIERLRSGFRSLLNFHYQQGHCAYPEQLALEESAQLLKVSISDLDEAVEIELLQEEVVSDTIQDTPCFYLKKIWELEQEVAIRLLAFQTKAPPWGWFNSPKVLAWAQHILDVRLAPGQIDAIETVLNSSLSIITGGPGTGKTTLIRSLVTILKTQFASFALCSPTGRAAQRLTEAADMPAQTIHRLLKYDSSKGCFHYNEKKSLNYDLVLIDEASMVDLELMAALLRALPKTCALVLVGDVDQIPSVGAGSLLKSLIDSNRFSVVTLTDIFRQSQFSSIKKNALRINAGQMPKTFAEAKEDFHYYPVQSTEDAKKVLWDLLDRVIPEQCRITDPSQSQILVPLNRGPLGTQELNLELQSFLAKKHQNPVHQSAEVALTSQGPHFKEGDKVMVVKNDYRKEVFNGDIGYIRIIDFELQIVEVAFDERRVSFAFEDLDLLTLAYAISVHKSQGSEYRAVIVLILNEHLPMAQRHLVYTAVTRGKEHVFLIAEPKALQKAIETDEPRWQKLTELLATA